MTEKARVTAKPEVKSENSVYHALSPLLSQSTHSPFRTRPLITRELSGLKDEDRTSGNMKGHASSIPEGHNFSSVRIQPKGSVRDLPIQAKLRINKPGDAYEQEADRVAEQVMRMEEPGVQRQVEKEGTLQAKEIHSQIPEVTPNLEAGINVIRGGGQPLPESTRAFFEPRFGRDFSQVQVHTDAKAAWVVNAWAFTAGQDVVFGVGEYAPRTGEGQRLLAHELTHVLQQCTITLQPGVDTAQSDDRIGYEDNIAKSVSQGKKLMPSAPLLVQRFPCLCDPFRSVDCFIQQFIGQIPQLIEEATISQVELVCQWVIGVTGADAVVFSLSGQIGSGLAVEGGAELIYARNLGWLTYGHFGAGLGTPGGAVEIGLIWNLTDPGAYEGSFMELAAGYFGTVSFSGFPSDAGCEEESPQGIKFGIGTPGGAILYEQYMQLSGQHRPAVAR